jgi:subtilase family serine protease
VDSITLKAKKNKKISDRRKIKLNIFLSCIVIAVLVLFLSTPGAMADYNYDGVPERAKLKEVKQGTVEGGVYISGDDRGLDISPYTQDFNVPEGNVTWARLYVGVWGETDTQRHIKDHIQCERSWHAHS